MTIPSSRLRTQRPRGVTQPKVARRMRGTAGPGRARAAEDFWGQYSPSPKGPVRDPAPAAPAVACFVEELGHLRGLPAAGLATHDDDGVLGHRLHDHLLFRENRELQPLFLPETGSQCSGTSVGEGVCACVPCGTAAGTRGLCSDKARLCRETWFLSSWQLARGLHRGAGRQVRPLENGSLDSWGEGRGLRPSGDRHGPGPWSTRATSMGTAWPVQRRPEMWELPAVAGGRGGLRLRHRRRDLPKSRGRAPSAPVLTNTGVTNLHFGGAVDGDEDGGLRGGPSQGGGCGWRSWRSSSSGLSGWGPGHWALAPSPRKSWWPTRCHHPCTSPHPLSGRGLLGVRLH